VGPTGAGKTTLMNVLCRRTKGTGDVQGEVRVNGCLQDDNSFRRVAALVEQFDAQTPALSVRETVTFSARLQLDEKTISKECIGGFVQQTLQKLELEDIADARVGSDVDGGLSFEQRKRLSIAVELVANPSILFADEPTSGLDARSAMMVMKGLFRVAQSGRAVCATIHQPAATIFSMFDSLLLLEQGRVVFHGDLGQDSANLIDYLESFPDTIPLSNGENAATWMLRTVGSSGSRRRR